MAYETIYAAYEEGRPRPRLASQDGKPVQAAPLVLVPARLPDPRAIPPRQWLYGTQLVRGFVTVLVAPGGTGKSSYAMVVAAALASGKKLLGEHVFARVNVAVFNLEDPMEELERRLAAIQIRHDLSRDDLLNRYYLNAGQDRPLVMACMDEAGYKVVHPDADTLIEQIRLHDIGLIVADPFAESHSLEENSNPQMVQAAAAWRRVARETNCAIMLVHHVRKGAVMDIDAARGAKALTDSARVGLLLSPMSVEEGEQLQVPPEERSLYARLDDAKANMAPKAGKARWFHLDRVDLHNTTTDYPNGDKVAAIVGWEPPSIWAGKDANKLNEALDIIAEPPAGWLYAPHRRGRDNRRWAGQVLVDVLGCNERQAAMMIVAWLKSGLLVEETYRDVAARKDRTGVRVDDSKRPTE